jgi:SAM-dependent methyltransferase
MRNNKKVKDIVKEKYGEIAVRSNPGCSCGCGSSSLPTGQAGRVVDYSIVKDEYTNIEGYVPEADLGLGCGLPTEFAGIKKGDVVVDLGSGAGNDVFIARSITGESGKVIGIDMTPEMIGKAKKNREKLGYLNVEFYLGDIEAIPLENSVADVVVSNCVLNLVPDKEKAFDEIFRILKPGGHFCVSDIVIVGELPQSIKKSAEMYAGCVAGAVQKEEYLGIIKNSGFTGTKINKTKLIDLPDNILMNYLTENELADYRKNGAGIFSITITASKN